MKIYLPIFSHSASGKVFDLEIEQNPGIGGTQHVTILLASRLAKAMPYWNIYLVNYASINLLASSTNLKQLKVDTFKDFCKILSTPEEVNSRSIISATLLEGSSVEELRVISNKIFCWFHHPFYFKNILKEADFLGYICVGAYQHASNCDFYPRCIHIQNIFAAPKRSISDKDNNINCLKTPLRLVHLGALVPDKGFLHIAKQWKYLKRSFANIRLDIIGSASTYNATTETHDLIPAKHSYANKILEFIPESDIHSGHCVFHGNLGNEKNEIIEASHFALQNPTGIREAFPASPLECMALGTPVIASGDYGMGDAMQYFPNLEIKRPSQIINKIQTFYSSIYSYNEVKYRSISVANMFALNSDSAIWKWIRILNASQDNIKAEKPYLPNRMGQNISLSRLNYRKAKSNLKSSIKRLYK